MTMVTNILFLFFHYRFAESSFLKFLLLDGVRKGKRLYFLRLELWCGCWDWFRTIWWVSLIPFLCYSFFLNSECCHVVAFYDWSTTSQQMIYLSKIRVYFMGLNPCFYFFLLSLLNPCYWLIEREPDQSTIKYIVTFFFLFFFLMPNSTIKSLFCWIL